MQPKANYAGTTEIKLSPRIALAFAGWLLWECLLRRGESFAVECRSWSWLYRFSLTIEEQEQSSERI